MVVNNYFGLFLVSMFFYERNEAAVGLNLTSIIPDDGCTIVETLIKNVNPFRSVNCFVFY